MKKALQPFALIGSKPIFYCIYLTFCLLLVQASSTFGQDPPQYGSPFAGVPDPRDVNMYQVHTRAYSTAGNLAGVTARLDAIKALGTNVIYLMPHYPVGQDSRSSISPYCIRDFKAVGAEYGNLNDLRALVDGAHSRGMAVMLDWVANQTSWDHAWITQHPDWYVRDGNGVIQPLNPFPDVAALNFNSSAMRTEMINSMRYWIFAANVDGFRCDYANNAPLDFWTQAINNLRGITAHKLLLFAEGDRLENFNAGFDFNFGDKWYYDAIRPVASGTSVAQLQTTTNTEYTFANSTQQVVRYTANHDTESGATPFSVFQNHAGVVVYFLVSAYMRGVPFLTSGQEVDFNQTIPWPYTTVKINWSANAGAAADFTRVLTFRTSSNAIRRGTLTNYSNTNICAFTKTAGSEKVVVIANLRNSTQSYVIPAALAGSYVDAYTNTPVTLTNGATQSLNAFQYRVLTNANVPTVPVTGVSVSPTSDSLNAGLTTPLTATVAPANATNKTVNWSSGNTSVATVNANGLVTAIAPGTAVITATTVDQNKTATASITVTPGSSFTVNFYKPANWGTGIRIYWWAAQPTGVLADGTWPGVNMTATGNGWYSYTFTNITATNLIFNDGTNQTANLTRNKTGWYYNGAWYDNNPGTPTTYYQIQNRWQSTSYLYDGGNGQVRYGTNAGTNQAYQWLLEDAGSGYVLLKNRGSGRYMHVENQNGSVQCSTISPGWYSAMWLIPAATDGWSYIQNRWQPSQWIHLENLLGYAQYSGAQTGWHSAMWKLVNPTTTTGAREEQLTPTDETATGSTVRVFPNPATGGYFNITLPATFAQPVTVSVRDLSGRLVLQKNITNSTRITHQLRPGVYFVQVTGRMVQASQKLVVQ